MTPTALMLFTAGLGTRMGALTRAHPKPLVEVAGKALVDHALDQVGPCAPERIVANLHYLPDQIVAHLQNRQNIAFSDETDTILDTGGGLKAAIPLLGGGPVFTLNTDAVWTGNRALATLAANWNPELMEGLLLLIPTERATGHSGQGDFCLDSHHRVTRGRGHVYTGAGILRTEGLLAFEERAFSLNRLWDRMIARGTLYGCVHGGGWCDVGRPESLAVAEALLSGDGNV